MIQQGHGGQEKSAQRHEAAPAPQVCTTRPVRVRHKMMFLPMRQRGQRMRAGRKRRPTMGLESWRLSLNAPERPQGYRPGRVKTNLDHVWGCWCPHLRVHLSAPLLSTTHFKLATLRALFMPASREKNFRRPYKLTWLCQCAVWARICDCWCVLRGSLTRHLF